MVRHLTLFGLAVLFSADTSLRSETIEHAGTTYWVQRVDPAKDNLELFLAEKAAEPNTFPKLEARLAAQGKRLRFALNSGIFEGNFLPTGLHIAEGKTIVPLNLQDYVKKGEGDLTPNFYLKPNGVFFLRENGTAAIAESTRYATLGEKPVLATQSGPLLVQGGAIHPVLQANSTSERYRNGVGVTKEGQVVLVCSRLEREKGMSNLYRFAELFRDRLACPDALYLDGDISYVYIRDLTGPIEETNFFAGILALTEPQP
jgi:uncharacterized protein YigE (DUF2233 family)